MIKDLGGNSIAAPIKNSTFNGHVDLVVVEAAKLGLETARKATCMPLKVKTICEEIIELAIERNAIKLTSAGSLLT